MKPCFLFFFYSAKDAESPFRVHRTRLFVTTRKPRHRREVYWRHVHTMETKWQGLAVRCRDHESKQYDEWKRALDAIESHIKSKCFLPILDDEGSTDGKIILNPSRKFQGTYVWKPTERPSKQHKVIHDSMPDKPSAVTAFAEKALEAVVKSHAQAIASKDETIRALTSALASRDEIIRVQAALISTLQG